MKNTVYLKLLQQARKTIPKTQAKFNKAFDKWSNDRLAASMPSCFICDNIESAASTTEERQAVEDLIALINTRLHHRFSLAHWLLDRGHITGAEFINRQYDSRVFDKLQVTRLAWLDALIVEFSSKPTGV